MEKTNVIRASPPTQKTSFVEEGVTCIYNIVGGSKTANVVWSIALLMASDTSYTTFIL